MAVRETGLERCVSPVFLIPASHLRSVRRALHMSVPELACRSRQATAKWLERSGVAGRSRVWHSTDVDALRLGWCTRFFADPQAGSTGAAADASLAPAIRHVIAHAERLCAGRFDLLGYRGM